MQELSEKLFEGELAINEFISEFKAKRTLAHMRRIKAEKMRELILEAERNPSQSSSTNTPAIPPRNQAFPPRPTPPYPGSVQPSYPNQYPPQAYPAGAFSQPAAQRYPGYQWN